MIQAAVQEQKAGVIAAAVAVAEVIVGVEARGRIVLHGNGFWFLCPFTLVLISK